jgi:RNA polymerase sigma-70 factor (ECF subfamily)
MMNGSEARDEREHAAWNGTDAPPSSRAVPMHSPRPALSVEATARFRCIVDDAFALVWRFLRGLGVDAAGVDDAAQQVFWIMAQRIGDVPEGSERAFLLATARGVAANVRRSQSRNREVADGSAYDDRRDEGADPEELVASSEARRLLDAFLESLGEETRTVFVLFELEGMTMSAIAELLELPPGTVASRLRRGRDEFHAAAKRFQSQRGGRR